MTLSMIENVLSRGSLVIGALALMGTIGCATEEDFVTDDTTSTEAVDSVAAELSWEDVCHAPYVNDHQAKEWKFYGEGSWLNSWTWYSTYNTYVDKYLKYGQRDHGLDLYYYEGGLFNFKYERQGGGDVHYGDKVAVKVGSWGYLYYAPQPHGYGFDLKFSNAPKYEWEIHGGQYGWKVPTNYKVSLHNEYRHDYMVYCKRGYGINLSWADECHDVGEHGRYYKGYCE